jgi:hypothetical protein
MQQISVPSLPPRDLNHKIPFHTGLTGYYFVGGIFTALSLIIVVSLVIPPHETGLILFKITGSIIFGALGISSLIRTYRTYLSRVADYTHGDHIVGTVEDHGRKIVPWKSFRDYTATVRFRPEGSPVMVVIQNSDKHFLRDLPIGSTVSAFYNRRTGSLFVPVEIGVRILLQDASRSPPKNKNAER